VDDCKPLELGRLTSLTWLTLGNQLTSIPKELGGRGLHSSPFQLNLSRF